MKNRTAYLMRLIFYPFIPILLFAAAYYCSGVMAWTIVLATIAVAGLFIALDTYCPACKKFGLLPRPHRSNAGYCTNCGELIEWKEKED